MENTDVAIIGAGIIGLSTAYEVTQRFPQYHVRVLEKEPDIGQHQTGHNSGVLHSGIYYQPGSLRATNCRSGKLAMETFCQTYGIPYDICGKVIVAVDDREVPALERIYKRGLANGVRCERISRERLRQLEPHAAGVQAIHVPETGIVDFSRVCAQLAELIRDAGGMIHTSTRVKQIDREGDRLVLQAGSFSLTTRWLINCAGLYSDRVTAMSGQRPAARIVPFRGEYFELTPDAFSFCRNLIYPVPDPEFPFLGVHFTRMIDGSVECGPNAVLAWAREGYRKRDINLRDLWDAISYPGFLKLAARYWRMGLGEMHRSFSKSAFVAALQRLVPEITADHLARGRAGVRAQALLPDGKLVDDFLIQQNGPIINVGNAPSPAATSALHIGKLIADKLG